jgi:DNA-binding transcriptional ArsR family regulator
MDEMNPVFETVARYFSLLGEPTRLKILHSICQEEKCVSDIIAATGISQTNASRHLGLMYQSGMLSRRREGNQIYYSVADKIFIELCRSVCTQVASREDKAPTSKKGFEEFMADMNELSGAVNTGTDKSV